MLRNSSLQHGGVYLLDDPTLTVIKHIKSWQCGYYRTDSGASAKTH